MSDFSLKAVFGMDATGFRAELKTLGSEMTNFANSWLTQVIGAGALVALAEQAGQLAVSIKNVSLALGISSTSYQALQWQAQAAGVSQEQFDKGLAKVKESVISAAKGNKELSDVFANLGLNTKALLELPLDQQYTAIARAATTAGNQADAFNDVVKIFGAKIGPQMLDSLHSLSADGLQGVIDKAKEAGEVLDESTIVSLATAMQAIDDFKKKVTVAVGKIIVDFRTEDGLAALFYRMMSIGASFGGKIVDAIVQGSQLITSVMGGALHGIVNDFRNWYIDAVEYVTAKVLSIIPGGKILVDIATGALDKLKTTGGDVSTSIAQAIAQTHATSFAQDWSQFWTVLADKSQAAANALDASQFSKGVQQLKDAGKPVAQDIELAADSIRQAGVAAGQAISKAVEGVAGGARGGSTFNQASDTALKKIIQDNNSRIHDLIFADNTNPNLTLANQGEIGRLQVENQNAQSQIDTRNKVRSGYAGGGTDGAYNAVPNIDPIQVDKIVSQFATLQTPATTTANTLKTISGQLASAGFAPTLG